ncbi:MAG: GAF and HD-GYP domain-containing protein [Planctomycetota bacterium]|jgi:HD-GYP domain-containing protein (c-di-GMP phosphodiesterase class II)
MDEKGVIEDQKLKKQLETLEYENSKCLHIIQVGLELASQVELVTLFPLVISKVTEVMEADRSSLFLYDDKAEELWTMVAEGLDTTQIRIPVDRGIAGYVTRTGKSFNIKDAYDSELFDRSIDKKTGYRTKSVLCMPMRNRNGKVLGVLQVLNKKTSPIFNEQDEDFLKLLAGQIAVYVENAALYSQIENLFENIVAAIAIAIDERDPVTAGHSRRVTYYTMEIARAMHNTKEGVFKDIEISRDELKELRYACLLHDFGKVGVPEAILQKAQRLPVNWINVIEQRLGRVYAEEVIKSRDGDNSADEFISSCLPDPSGSIEFLKKLNTAGFLDDEAAAEVERLVNKKLLDAMEHKYFSIKKGTLTDEERDIMQSHVEKTESVLNAIPWPDDMKNVPAIAGSHHEALDGKGYPKGLGKDEIPLGGKIMAVADVYDALTAQDRPYKPAIPHEKSAGILRGMAKDNKLDSNIVEFFLTNELYIIKDESLMQKKGSE